MPNERIYYPVHHVALKPDGVVNYTSDHLVHGVQSVDIDTSFDLQQIFEYGQLGIYDNIENSPEITVNLSKVLDAWPPMVTLATTGADNPQLQSRANEKNIFALSLYQDTISSTDGIEPETICEASGLYLSSITYNFPLEENFNESVSFIGQDRIWKHDVRIVESTASGRAVALSMTAGFDGADEPSGLYSIGRRQYLLLTPIGSSVDANGISDETDVSVFPTDIFGVGSDGINTLANDDRARLNDISVSVDLNIEPLEELGKKASYFRSATFPVDVTTEISITAISGDFISVTEEGILTTNTDCTGDLGNISDQTIRIATCDGLRLFLGSKNRLTSVNYGGGDAGGGNVTISYSYTNSNDLNIMHLNDPAFVFGNNDAFNIDSVLGKEYLINNGINTFSSLADDLFAYYKFDESALADAIPSQGSEILSDDGGSIGVHSAGKINTARLFANSADFFTATGGPEDFNTSSQNNDFTVSIWANPSNAGASVTGQVIGLWTETDNERAWRINQVGSDWEAQVSWNGSVGGIRTVTKPGPLLDTWSFLVLRVSGSNPGSISLNVNDSPISTTSNNDGINQSTGNLLVGTLDGTTPYDFEGSVDELGMWRRRLTDEEITLLYNGGTPPEYPFL